MYQYVVDDHERLLNVYIHVFILQNSCASLVPHLHECCTKRILMYLNSSTVQIYIIQGMHSVYTL